MRHQADHLSRWPGGIDFIDETVLTIIDNGQPATAEINYVIAVYATGRQPVAGNAKIGSDVDRRHRIACRIDEIHISVSTYGDDIAVPNDNALAEIFIRQ